MDPALAVLFTFWPNMVQLPGEAPPLAAFDTGTAAAVMDVNARAASAVMASQDPRRRTVSRLVGMISPQRVRPHGRATTRRDMKAVVRRTTPYRLEAMP